MFKSYIVLLTIFLCSIAQAEPVTFTCERPAWDGKIGCEATSAYETFAFHVDSDTFEADLIANKKSFRYSKPTYVYNRTKSCDMSVAVPYRGRFKANEDTITFWLVFHPGQYVQVDRDTRITLNLKTMTATLKPAESGSELTCVRGTTLGDEQFANMMRNAHDAGYLAPTSATSVTER